MIGFYKGQANDYILKYKSGSVVAEGPGRSFYYLRFNTQIVAVPTNSQDANFVFNEVTNNFQEVTIQGQLTYRIADPKKAAGLLNFTVNPIKGTFTTNDPEKLAKRIANIVQIETRAEIRSRTLEETLRDSQTIAAAVLARSKTSAELDPLGIELLSVYFLSARPSPEVGKALEAEYREDLLRKADEATYARRAAAVEEERKIKEKELATDRTLEEQRQELIRLQGANSLKEAENNGQATLKLAEYETKATEIKLALYKDMDPRALLAHAIKELGQNAERVGNLTITTEMLASLLGDKAG